MNRQALPRVVRVTMGLVILDTKIVVGALDGCGDTGKVRGAPQGPALGREDHFYSGSSIEHYVVLIHAESRVPGFVYRLDTRIDQQVVDVGRVDSRPAGKRKGGEMSGK